MFCFCLFFLCLHHAPGGFNKFQSEYPEHCETNLDCSCPSSSPPASVLGLGGLRISSDCSDGESDREPGSATESEGSPLPNNQPAFPVQILPYLYLGCAKDSANLDVLSKYNIKYILNVTPNLPNMFEHEGDFKYKQIPISDHWSQNLSQFFPEAISFIGEWRMLCSCVFGSGQGSEEVKFIINQCAGWAQGLIRGMFCQSQSKIHMLDCIITRKHLEPKNKALYECMSMDECEKERKKKNRALSAQLESQSYKSAI